MRWKDTTLAFGRVAIANHWPLAAVVIALLVSGIVAAELADGALRTVIVGPHKAVGVPVPALVAWMVAWWALQRERPGPSPEPFSAPLVNGR